MHPIATWRRLTVALLLPCLLGATFATAEAAGRPKTSSTLSVPVVDGYQIIKPYGFAASCGSFRSGPQYVSPNLPVRLQYGWAALQTQQLDQFLAVQNGTLTLTTSAGDPVYSKTWATGETTGWSSYSPQQLTPSATQDGATYYDGWATWRNEDFGQLQTGTYYLSMDLQLTTGVNDGFGAGTPGSWIKLTNCELIVTS